VAGNESAGAPEIEAALALEDAEHGEADRHQRRLRVLGQREVAVRPLEDHAGEVLAERVVDLREDLAGAGEAFGEIAPHADRLRALPGKNQRTCHAQTLPAARGRRRPLIDAHPVLSSRGESGRGGEFPGWRPAPLAAWWRFFC